MDIRMKGRNWLTPDRMQMWVSNVCTTSTVLIYFIFSPPWPFMIWLHTKFQPNPNLPHTVKQVLDYQVCGLTEVVVSMASLTTSSRAWLVPACTTSSALVNWFHFHFLHIPCCKLFSVSVYNIYRTPAHPAWGISPLLLTLRILQFFFSLALLWLLLVMDGN